MGRTLKRVPMDFDWPLKEIWKGYVNPHYIECPDCRGSGSTSAMKRLDELASLILLSGDDARRGKCHPYFARMEGLYHTAGVAPSPDMAELTAGLAKRASGPGGHDVIDRGSAVHKIIEAAGMPENWGWCKACNGDGIPVDKQKAYEAWESFEPPEGEGFQLWETTSEGSPMSPVFSTLDELCEWLGETGASTFGSQTATAAAWEKMLSEDLVMVEIGPGMLAI